MNVLDNAHRIETTLIQNGTLTLEHLPFQAGEAVEVFVVPNPKLSLPQDRYSLRGMTVRYQDPFEPVNEEDWEALA